MGADLEPGPKRRKLRQQLQKLTGTPLEKTAQTDEVKALKERIAAMKPSPERKQLRQQLKKLQRTATGDIVTDESTVDAPSEPSEFSSDIHLDAALVVVPIQAEY